MAYNKIRRVRGVPTLSLLVRSTIWLLEMTIHEIFADNDSENEDEFEGFDPGDIY